MSAPFFGTPKVEPAEEWNKVDALNLLATIRKCCNWEAVSSGMKNHTPEECETYFVSFLNMQYNKLERGIDPFSMEDPVRRRKAMQSATSANQNGDGSNRSAINASDAAEQSQDSMKKRARRKATQIKRLFQCPADSCGKSYGTEGALKMHLKLKHPNVDYDPMNPPVNLKEVLASSQQSQSQQQQQQDKDTSDKARAGPATQLSLALAAASDIDADETESSEEKPLKTFAAAAASGSACRPSPEAKPTAATVAMPASVSRPLGSNPNSSMGMNGALPATNFQMGASPYALGSSSAQTVTSPYGYTGPTMIFGLTPSMNFPASHLPSPLSQHHRHYGYGPAMPPNGFMAQHYPTPPLALSIRAVASANNTHTAGNRPKRPADVALDMAPTESNKRTKHGEPVEDDEALATLLKLKSS